jgi:aldehyde dehydrogenase (NAD+)
MLAWKIAPALAAGNTVVLKPAEFTPLSALAFAQLCRDIALPPGVVNIVCGDGSTGAALVAHPGVDKLAFTGSTEVGREIRRATAGSGKKLSLELGGKSPFIVFEDADIDSAVEGVVDAIWFNQGEVCCAGSRLLVHEGIADRFHAKLKRRMERLRVGDPLDKSTDIGAIVAPVQLARLTELVEMGRREGGTVWTPVAELPAAGWFYPPTLITGVAPASTVAEIEIFGPVAVSLTFRTPAEAIALANNTRYGLAASVWSENINVALDVAAAVNAGVVWINATNLFDAAAGFGGYKESGFGREGGREGMGEYLTAEDAPAPPSETTDGAASTFGAVEVERDAGFGHEPETTIDDEADRRAPALGDGRSDGFPAIDRTAKLYIGGKQVRPDSGYSYPVYAANGALTGQAPLGNRKDIRNAVEAAAKAAAWSAATAHNRAQVLYFVAENLAARAAEFASRIAAATGSAADAAAREVACAVERIFWYAAWADKFDGRIHATKSRHVTLAFYEPWGVMGIVCPSALPLAAFVSLVMPAVALGNRVVVVPSQTQPLIATDLYQVFETSDVPAGAINIVTGERDALGLVLAEHHDVAALWYRGPAVAAIERASASNLKATWVQADAEVDWLDPDSGQGRRFLEHAVQTKNVWIPYGA